MSSFKKNSTSEESIDKFLDTAIKDPSASDFKKFVRKTWLDDGYRPSISRIIIDRNFIFIFLSNIDNNRMVQVFDSNINKIIYEFKWPIEFEKLYSIGNGRFCLVSYDDEGLPILRKYKINPIVYGLPEDTDWKKKKKP